jgi:Na+/melibiose symporter-like transporter
MRFFSSVERPATGLMTKLFYGFGSVAFGVKDNGFSAFLLLFYNQVLGLPAAWVGAAIMIALAVDSVLDPLVGQISDNWNSRWGRRHPFMYFAALPAAAAYFLLWCPPAGLTQIQLFFYLLVMAIVVRSLITLYEIPSTALGTELSENYDQRTSLFGFRFFFGWWGGLALTATALGVLLKPDADHPVGQLNPVGYAHYGAVSAVIMVFAILISAAGTHRFIAHLKVPPKGAAFNLGDWIKAVKGTFANPSFRAIMASALFTSMSGGLALAMNSYFVTFLWELSNAQYAVLLGSAFISALVALLVSPHLSKAFGKKPATLLLYGLSAVIGPLPFILRLLGWFPGNESTLLVPILFLSTTVSLSFSITANILGTSMIADIAEDIEVKTGKRSEGLLFSASSVIAKAVSGVGIFVSGMILSIVHFPADAVPGQVPQAVLQHLLLTYLPVSVSLHILAIWTLTRYQITRARHEANLAELAARQA